MDLLDTLKKYGNPVLGYPSETTIERMKKASPELIDNLEKLLMTSVTSIKAPLYHKKLEDGTYLPILEEYVPYLQVMIANRYSSNISVGEAIIKLESLGFNVSSRGQISNIWNRMETKLGLASKERSAVADSKARVVEAKKAGKSCTKPYTEERKKQLDAARKIRMEKALIAKLDKERALANARLAKTAAKKGMSIKELKATTAEKEEAKGDLKVTEDPMEEAKRKVLEKGKKVLYEPTPKQAEFHSADEDIVLYGGCFKSHPNVPPFIERCR